MTGFVLAFGRERSLVPEEGFEPSLSCPRRILSPLRLPFRHSGMALILTLIAPRVKPDDESYGTSALF